MVNGLKFDSGCIESDNLPSKFLIDKVCESLWETDETSVPGYLRIDGLGEFFKSHDLTAFGMGYDEIRVCHSTIFVKELINRAYARRLNAEESSTARHITFNGLETVSKAIPADVLFADIGGPAKYHIGTRIGVEKNAESLEDMARSTGADFSIEDFFSDCVKSKSFHSTKIPHFDAETKVGALERYSFDVEGGNSVISNVGEFCNTYKVPLWEVIAPFLPDPESVYQQGAPRDFLPFNTFVVKEEYLADLKPFSIEVTNGQDQILLFNNEWQMSQSGKFFGIAHGATTPTPLSNIAFRMMTLSFVTKTLPRREIARLRRKIKIK